MESKKIVENYYVWEYWVTLEEMSREIPPWIDELGNTLVKRKWQIDLEGRLA